MNAEPTSPIEGLSEEAAPSSPLAHPGDLADLAPETEPVDGVAGEEASPTASGEVPETDAPGEELQAPQPLEEPEHEPLDLEGTELEQNLFALLLASPDALSASRLAGILGGTPAGRVGQALAALAERLTDADPPMALREISGGWRLFTDPAFEEVVLRLKRKRRTDRISPAALETLAIVAYKPDVTNAEVEAIRGVQSGTMLRTLVDRGLLKVTGRADQPGAPLTYAPSKEFLDRFGLGSLNDLPRDAELAKE